MNLRNMRGPAPEGRKGGLDEIFPADGQKRLEAIAEARALASHGEYQGDFLHGRIFQAAARERRAPDREAGFLAPASTASFNQTSAVASA